MSYEKTLGPDGWEVGDIKPASVGGVAVVRGVSQAMNIATEGFSGGTGVWSKTHRTAHYLKLPFKRFKIPLPVFYTDGNNYDALLPEDYNWQVGFESSLLRSMTGIPARKVVTFDGAGIAQYKFASPPSKWYILSDWIELDEVVPAGQVFGFHTTIEAAARTGNSKIPYTRNGSNYFQRYIGAVSANGVSQIDANTAITGTSYNATSSSQSGASEYYTPAMMLIETDAGIEFISIVGSSIPAGIGEAGTGSGAYGDTMGSALGNRGFLERGIMENSPHQLAGQYSKGSQTLIDFLDSSHWKGRRDLLELANPTVVINGLGRNDVAGTQTVVSRAVTTAYNKFDDVRANGVRSYIAMSDGTTSSTTTYTPTGELNSDDTIFWKYIGSFTGTGTQAPVVIGDMLVVNQQIKTSCPNAKLVGLLPTLGTTSTDNFTTVANQTARTNFDQPDGKRSIVYQLMNSLKSQLGFATLIDVNPAIESGGANTTGKWLADGVTPNLVVVEGIHPNSYGHYLGSQLVPIAFNFR